MIKQIKLSILTAFLIIFLSQLVSSETPTIYEITDAHNHYTDILQNSNGINAYIKCMDAAKVSDSILTGFPLSESREEGIPLDSAMLYWDKETDYIIAEAYKSATTNQQKRLHPFLCGINGNDLQSLNHIKRMIQLYPGTWQGIGEIFSYHDFLSWRTYGNIPSPNSPAYNQIYQFAAKYQLPVLIHCNMTLAGSKILDYLPEMIAAISNNPKTTFIWTHVGVSNQLKIENLTIVADKLLTEHSNLYFDISWLVYDNDIAKNNNINPEWITLIEKHPTKFMIGADLTGKYTQEAYIHEIRKYDLLLNKLQPETAKNVAKNNFMRLLPNKGITLLSEDRVTI
ncbi:MAG: amidohydrolase [Patescibacteria group bacterium]|jgi:hypothetical protein